MRMPTVSRRQVLAYAVVILALLALVGRSLVGGGSDSSEAAKPGRRFTRAGRRRAQPGERRA